MIIKTSMAIDEMSGSAGSVTAAKNANRQYLKKRVTPKNPRTSAQLEVRARMAANAKGFANLSEAQRVSFNEFARSLKGRAVFGESAVLSGANVYTRLNNNLMLVGQAAIYDVPEIPVLPVFSIASFSATKGASDAENAMTLSLTGLSGSTNSTLVINATAQFSAGRAKASAALRVIDTVDADISDAVDLKQAYVDKFGEFPQEGNKIQVEVYVIDNVTGFATLKQSIVAIVAGA